MSTFIMSESVEKKLSRRNKINELKRKIKLADKEGKATKKRLLQVWLCSLEAEELRHKIACF